MQNLLPSKCSDTFGFGSLLAQLGPFDKSRLAGLVVFAAPDCFVIQLVECLLERISARVEGVSRAGITPNVLDQQVEVNASTFGRSEPGAQPDVQPLGCIGGQGTLFFHVNVGFFCFLVTQGLAERRANADQQIFAIHIHHTEHLRLPNGVVCSNWSDGEGDTRQPLQAFQDSAQCGTTDTKAEDIGQFSGCGGNRQTGSVLCTKFQVESIACFLHLFVRAISANANGSAWYRGQIKHGEKNTLILDAQALG